MAKALEYEIYIGILVLIFVYFITAAIKRARSNFPPGTVGLPIVGYFPFLTENIHSDLIELGKKYGDAFSICLGFEIVVILHGADAIKEAFAKPEFLVRLPEAFSNSSMHKGFEEVVAQAKAVKYEIYIGISVLILVYLISAAIQRARSNFPPGPFGLPIFGYLPFLTENIHTDLIELGKKYGDVFSLRLGSELLVILHGSDAIREALGKPEFLGKPPDGVLNLISKHSSFFVADVNQWREHRRFVVQSMKDLGLGKSKIEVEIQDELANLLEILRSRKGKPMDLKEPLSPSISNNICALVFGKRYEYDDPDRMLLDKNLDNANESLSQTTSYTFFPWMRRIPFHMKFLRVENAKIAYATLREFFKHEIKKHKDTLDPKNMRDFIDKFFVEMESRKKNNPETTFNDDTLASNVLDLFGGGSETVRSTILWSVYIIAAFPDVQKKVRKEIFDIMGPDRNPNFEDLKNMPYTHAVIMEIMRWKTIVPLSLMRYTLEDTTVGGYDIPQGTTVMANFWNSHHDPRYWSEPDSFKPERFLSKDGNSVVKSSNYMSFSLGKRACPGETMAYMEIFLYFTSMIQKFDIEFPEGVKPTFEAKLCIVYRMNPYKIRFIPRS